MSNIIRRISNSIYQTMINNRIKIAANLGNYKVVNKLLKYPIDYDTIRYVFLTACRKNYIDIIDRLLEDSRLPIETFESGLLMSIRKNNLELFHKLTQDSRYRLLASISNIMLRIAVSGGYFEIIDELLNDTNIDPFIDNGRILEVAINYNYDNPKIVSRLLDDPRIDPTVQDNYALRYACSIGDLDLFNKIYNNPILVIYNIRDIFGDACRGGNIDIVKILLKDININKSDYNFGFGSAIARNKYNVVKLLLNDPRVEFDNSILITPSSGGYHRILNLLLDWRGPNGEKLDPSYNNNLCIRMASTYKHIEVVRMLLKYFIMNGYNMIPIININKYIKKEYKKLLKQYVFLHRHTPKEIPKEISNEIFSYLYGSLKIKKLRSRISKRSRKSKRSRR